MKKVSENELARLKAISVLDLATQRLGAFRKEGKDYYRHHSQSDNLVINATANSFFDNRTGKRGKGAISFLMDYCGLPFLEAVETLNRYSPTLSRETNENSSAENRNTGSAAPHFSALPKPNPNLFYRVFAYLTKTRKIAPALVRELAQQGLLYADDSANAVFLNQAKTSATLRGTLSAKRYVANRGEADVFSLTRGCTNTLYVFESPIDLLSFLTLYQDTQGVLVSLNGNSNLARITARDFLKRFQSVLCCCDNDTQGDVFLDALKRSYGAVIDRRPPKEYKDFNEYLCKR